VSFIEIVAYYFLAADALLGLSLSCSENVTNVLSADSSTPPVAGSRSEAGGATPGLFEISLLTSPKGGNTIRNDPRLASEALHQFAVDIRQLFRDAPTLRQ